MSKPAIRSQSKTHEAKSPPPTKTAIPSSSSRLLKWDDLPSWQRDNHYILTAYRPASGSYLTSLASLNYTHNESVNIWSHVVGALLFGLLGPFLYVYSTLPSHTILAQLSTTAVTQKDIVVFSIFFLSALACLGMSGTYHAVSNHSQKVARNWNKLDYVGIVVLIWGSFVPSIYYGFACDKLLVNVYWAMITTLGIGCAIVSTISSFRTPAWRPFRAGLFAAMGLSAVVPVLHGLNLYGLQRMMDQIGLPWLVLQGVLYLVGAGLYAARFPERMKPGTFDVYGSSHQIFHVLIVLAAGAHLIGLIRGLEYHHSNSEVVRCRI